MVALLLIAALAHAKELAGVTLADTVIVGGEAVKLNGLGLRERYFLDIYVGALYLQHPTHDAATAIAADEPKRVLMHFTYKSITRDQMVATFVEGFGDMTAGPHAASVAKVGSWIPAGGVKGGDEIGFDYLPGVGTSMTFNGRVLGTIPGVEFMKLIFGVYLGPKPPTEALKAGLLSG